MKIAIYNQDLSGGGAERVSLALLKPLHRMGANVTLLLHRHEGALVGMVPDDVRVVAFNTRRTINDIVPLARYLLAERPDVLLANLNHNNVVALLAKAIVASRVRVYICQHNALSQESGRTAPLQYRIIPTMYHYLAPLAHGIIAVSNGVADDLATISRIDRNRVTTIYNPVIEGDFPAKMRQVVEHPWLGDSIPLFVTAGRLVPQKDHATLLRALARMHRPSRLLILGTGEQQSKLATLSHDLGIADRVCFAGFVTNPLPYIRSATAFILCSAYEGFGNAIVEALGCGTPVISTDCPYGPSEILANGRYGTLVPVGGVQALADAMETAGPISSAKRRDLRNRAAAFTADRAAQSYHKLLVSPSCMASQSASFS